jgi:H+/Cl- antiporter ClcA
MVCSSQFSIIGGGSLGPEAPLVAICAALGGYISMTVFQVSERNLIRKHTLMGMCGALAAFFGVPLGGSLFALEVNSRFGVEYFEHSVEAIFSGEICLAVFRTLAGLPLEPIWMLTENPLKSSTSIDIIYGAVIGFLGAFTAWIFAFFHRQVIAGFRGHNLLSNENAVPRAMLGAIVVVLLGMLVPHTL